MHQLSTGWVAKSLLILFATSLLTACASMRDLGPQPVQSPNDDYGYRYLVLDNQMPVLLISDPDAPKAAASLDVMVGSGDNPPGRGGLAPSPPATLSRRRRRGLSRRPAAVPACQIVATGSKRCDRTRRTRPTCAIRSTPTFLARGRP